MDFYADEFKINCLHRIEPREHDTIKRSAFGFDAVYVVKRTEDSDFRQDYNIYARWYYPSESFYFSTRIPRYYENDRELSTLGVWHIDGISALTTGDIERWAVEFVMPFILTLEDVVKMSHICVRDHYKFINWDSIQKKQQLHPYHKPTDDHVEAIKEKMLKLFPTRRQVKPQ